MVKKKEMACKSVLQGAHYLVLHSLSFALFPFDQKFRPVWKFPVGNGTILSTFSGVVPKFSKISCPKFLYYLFFISEFSVKLFSFGIHVTNFRIFQKLSVSFTPIRMFRKFWLNGQRPGETLGCNAGLDTEGSLI